MILITFVYNNNLTVQQLKSCYILKRGFGGSGFKFKDKISYKIDFTIVRKPKIK